LAHSGLKFVFLKARDLLCLRARLALAHCGVRLSPRFPIEIVRQWRIPCRSVPNVHAPEVVHDLRSFAPEVLVTAGFGQILKKEALQIPSLAALNVHPSVLPRHPGPNPYREILRSGDRTAGVTIHRLVEAVDAGEILLQAEYEIPKSAGQRQLCELAARKGAELLPEVLESIERSAQR